MGCSFPTGSVPSVVSQIPWSNSSVIWVLGKWFCSFRWKDHYFLVMEALDSSKSVSETYSFSCWMADSLFLDFQKNSCRRWKICEQVFLRIIFKRFLIQYVQFSRTLIVHELLLMKRVIDIPGYIEVWFTPEILSFWQIYTFRFFILNIWTFKRFITSAWSVHQFCCERNFSKSLHHY